MNSKIIETDFEKAKKWVSGEFIEDDLLLLDRLAEAPFPSEPRRMNFILIGLCTHGHVKYRMDTVEYMVNPGEIIVVSERHVIDNYMASPDLQGLCMMVSVPFFQETIKSVNDISALFLFTRNHPVMQLTEREVQVFHDYFYVIRKRIAETDNHFRRDLVRTLMLAMFYDLSNIIYRSQEAMERKSETVKVVSMRTPNEWIDNYVTLEMRVMLKNTTKTIKQIAEDMNFPNQSFLGKYFKEHVGMSPSEYRRT